MDKTVILDIFMQANMNTSKTVSQQFVLLSRTFSVSVGFTLYNRHSVLSISVTLILLTITHQRIVRERRIVR